MTTRQEVENLNLEIQSLLENGKSFFGLDKLRINVFPPIEDIEKDINKKDFKELKDCCFSIIIRDASDLAGFNGLKTAIQPVAISNKGIEKLRSFKNRVNSLI